MSKVSEHNGEEEWECYNGVYCRVGFLVIGYSIRVNQLLEGCGKLVRAEKGRWSFFGWHLKRAIAGSLKRY